MMKKKMLSILLASAMCISLLAGCGSTSEDSASETTETEETTDESTEETTESTEEETTSGDAAEDTTGSSVDGALDGVHLKMAINAEYAPFESVNEDGDIVGFDIELNEILAERLGYTFEIDNMDFTSLVPSI